VGAARLFNSTASRFATFRKARISEFQKLLAPQDREWQDASVHACVERSVHPSMDYIHFIGVASGHIASILTMVAYLLRDILWLRFLTILSCFAGIAFLTIVPQKGLYGSPSGGTSVFAIINIVQIAIIIKERTGIHFTEEEKELHETLFKNSRPSSS
jgi:hypothetical protein